MIGCEDDAGGRIFLDIRQGDRHLPMQLNSEDPAWFETESFTGKCLFMHRPAWSFDNRKPDTYPFREHFHGRKRLWELRIQGRFKRTPGVLYCGIELEEYVAVTWGTRALMKGMMPLIKKVLGCNQVHHEIGNDHDASLRPVVVAPIWAADNTLIHEDREEAPPINTTTLPTGLSRKGAREYWETLWNGGSKDNESTNPTYTFAIWGVSPLLDLRAWAFRNLPMTWGGNLSMEPFCGRQPVHAVVYELEKGKSDHRQQDKIYMFDMRIVPEHIWTALSMGPPSPQAARIAAESCGIDDDLVSFCSALSDGGDSESLLLDVDEVSSNDGDVRPETSLAKRAAISARRGLEICGRMVHFQTLVWSRRWRTRRKTVILCVSILVAFMFFVMSGWVTKWSKSLPRVKLNLEWDEGVV